jgi:hypothetical protein
MITIRIPAKRIQPAHVSLVAIARSFALWSLVPFVAAWEVTFPRNALPATCFLAFAVRLQGGRKPNGSVPVQAGDARAQAGRPAGVLNRRLHLEAWKAGDTIGLGLEMAPALMVFFTRTNLSA